MNVATRRKPKSRFSRTPVTSADGTARTVPSHRLTEQDLALLRLLARRRFLSVDYIAALIGTSYKYALSRVQILKSEPNLYIKVSDTPAREPGRTIFGTPLFYELDKRGIGELEERDIHIPLRRPVRNLTHAVMVEQIMASFEIALIGRADILLKAPDKTRALAVPERIPLPRDRFIRPDGEMFVLKTPDGFSFFPGIEADTGTEPIHSYDYERSSITAKFSEYIEVIENRIYETHFGARTFLIPLHHSHDSSPHVDDGVIGGNDEEQTITTQAFPLQDTSTFYLINETPADRTHGHRGVVTRRHNAAQLHRIGEPSENIISPRCRDSGFHLRHRLHLTRRAQYCS